MTPAELKDRILLALEPHVDALAGEIVALVSTLVHEKLATILAAAAMEGAAPAKKVAKAKPAIATPAKSKPAANSGLTSKGTPRQRIGSCGKCGEVGKRSDSCGITHNVKAKKTSSSTKIVKRPAPVVVVTPDTPPPGRAKHSPADIAHAKARIAARAERAAEIAKASQRRGHHVAGPAPERDEHESEAPLNFELPTPRASFDL